MSNKMVGGTELTPGQRKGLGIFLIIVVVLAVALVGSCVSLFL